MDQKTGCYPFTTYERLEFTTTAAGTNEIQTVSESGIPTGGNYFIEWVTPTSLERTTLLAYNATTADIKAAIETLNSFDGTITAANALSAGGSCIYFWR